MVLGLSAIVTASMAFADATNPAMVSNRQAQDMGVNRAVPISQWAVNAQEGSAHVTQPIPAVIGAQQKAAGDP